MNHTLKSHASLPRNLGSLSSPEGYANPVGPCGESLELFLRINGETIQNARFIPHGCAYTTACGSLLTEMLRGISLDEAFDLDGDSLERALGGLPEDHKHCAELAAQTLRDAIGDYYQNKKAPWKKLYAK